MPTIKAKVAELKAQLQKKSSEARVIQGGVQMFEKSVERCRNIVVKEELREHLGQTRKLLEDKERELVTVREDYARAAKRQRTEKSAPWRPGQPLTDSVTATALKYPYAHGEVIRSFKAGMLVARGIDPDGEELPEVPTRSCPACNRRHHSPKQEESPVEGLERTVATRAPTLTAEEQERGWDLERLASIARLDDVDWGKNPYLRCGCHVGNSMLSTAFQKLAALELVEFPGWTMTPLQPDQAYAMRLVLSRQLGLDISIFYHRSRRERVKAALQQLTAQMRSLSEDDDAYHDQDDVYPHSLAVHPGKENYVGHSDVEETDEEAEPSDVEKIDGEVGSSDMEQIYEEARHSDVEETAEEAGPSDAEETDEEY